MKNYSKLLMTYSYHGELKSKYVTLKEVVDKISNCHYQRRVNAVRGLDEVPTGLGMNCGPMAAEGLPSIYPSKGLKGYTGLILLSFRVADNQEVLERLRRQVVLWPQTLMTFLGTSGQSLKVLLPYQLPDGGLPVESQQITLFHQYAYKKAAEYAFISTGVRPEEIIHDGSEHFRISADKQIFVNDDALPVIMELPTHPLEEIPLAVTNKQEEKPLDTQVLPGYTRREMDVVRYNAICRELSFGKVTEFEDHLMHLAVACRKAGVDRELAMKMTLETFDCFDKEVLVRSTFNTAYERQKMGRDNPIEGTLIHQLLLEEFLKRRYMFRRNRVTGDVEVQEKYRFQLWWKPLTEAVRNDINNAAIREGIKVWPKDLDRILVSEHVREYDPVREWLDQLPRWDGRDRLGELARRVKTNTPDWEDNFRVWMRSMVSQWCSGQYAMYGAQMVLMLVGGQGTRKSTFMRMLLPRELMPYYIDRIDFVNKKEALRALSRFLLINIDEYDQISKSQTAFLKHLIQRTDVKDRKLYTTTYEQQQRYAAFCATTNSLVPLIDESGSRRYLVVEVTDVIDTDMEGDNRIDYQQLYAQITEEIRQGFDYSFTGERERKIIANNADYYETPNIISLFEDHFSKPKEGNEVVWMSPTEILGALHADVSNRSNATMVGSYLRRNQYVRGSGKERRRYMLAISNANAR